MNDEGRDFALAAGIRAARLKVEATASPWINGWTGRDFSIADLAARTAIDAILAYVPDNERRLAERLQKLKARDEPRHR
jgi:hypothetical protein